MPTGKRASMREGPLAALFRRTTDEPTPDSPAADAPPPAGDERAPETASPPPAQEPMDLEQPRIPSPQERLRQAFSSDIPESLLERPAPTPAPARPHRDALAGRYSEGFTSPAPLGSP